MFQIWPPSEKTKPDRTGSSLTTACVVAGTGAMRPAWQPDRHLSNPLRAAANSAFLRDVAGASELLSEDTTPGQRSEARKASCLTLPTIDPERCRFSENSQLIHPKVSPGLNGEVTAAQQPGTSDMWSWFALGHPAWYWNMNMNRRPDVVHPPGRSLDFVLRARYD